MATVETFSMTLRGLLPWPVCQSGGSASGESALTHLEESLAARLPDCERLLRWAIVGALPESSAILCEGAYLRREC
jgi:hypothetical protein